MKRASYRDGVAWIALNDEAGSEDRLNEEVVKSYISTILLADLFGKPEEDVAKDIVRYRVNDAKKAKDMYERGEHPERFHG